MVQPVNFLNEYYTSSRPAQIGDNCFELQFRSKNHKSSDVRMLITLYKTVYPTTIQALQIWTM